jgi:protein-tyrosine phosphatase
VGRSSIGLPSPPLGIGGSHYLLVELPINLWPEYAFEALFQLQCAGFQPILAHVERYEAVLRDIDVSRELIRRGVLLQVDGGSLLGESGHRLRVQAQALVANNLVSFLCSDAHSPKQRPLRLRAAAAAAARLIGKPAAEALVNYNPAAVIADADLSPPTARQRRHFFPWPLRWTRNRH